MSCIFCEIAKGNIPSHKIYEDDICLAFLDLSQATIGHTLVIPKEHFENILDLNEDIASHLFKVVTMLSKRICKALNVNNVNILNNSGELSGQTVMHFHIHIIPRYEKTDVQFKLSHNELSKDEFANLCEKLKG